MSSHCKLLWVLPASLVAGCSMLLGGGRFERDKLVPEKLEIVDALLSSPMEEFGEISGHVRYDRSCRTLSWKYKIYDFQGVATNVVDVFVPSYSANEVQSFKSSFVRNAGLLVKRVVLFDVACH